MTIPEEKRAGYISLKEASERFGYSQDYLGQLIRKGKLDGKLVYSHVAWVTTPEAILEYIEFSKNKKSRKVTTEAAETIAAQQEIQASSLLEVSELEASTVVPHEVDSSADSDLDAQSSRTAKIIILLIRVLIVAVVLIAIFVFYILTTAFSDEVKSGSRVAHASQSFSLSLHADQHE